MPLNRLMSADGSVIPDKPIYGLKEFEYLPNNNIATKDGRTFLYNATVVRDGQTVTLPHAVSEIKDDAGNTLYAYEYDRNGNMTRAVGQSTITIRAKKGAGSLTPRMELWLNGIQYQAWLVDNDEYHDYTWSGRLDNTGTIDVIYVNGDEAADLFVEHVTVNGTVILTTDTTKVVFDPGDYYEGCVDNVGITAGQVPLTQTGGLRFSANGIAVLNRLIAYDVENRVVSITENGNTSIFTYDCFGTRIRKTETFNGVTTTTYYIGGKYEITNRSGQPTKLISYYFANGQRIAQRTDDSTTSEMLYYHTDHLGSAVRLTNEAGEPVQSIAYAPFGETVFYSGVKDPKYQYTGQEFDASSGLYYYGARYYCPEIGRFIQPDTFLDGLNRYAYCWNNPMNYVDPTGRYSEGANAHATHGGNMYSGDGSFTGTGYASHGAYGFSPASISNQNGTQNKNAKGERGSDPGKSDPNTGIVSPEGVDGYRPGGAPTTGPYEGNANEGDTGPGPGPDNVSGPRHDDFNKKFSDLLYDNAIRYPTVPKKDKPGEYESYCNTILQNVVEELGFDKMPFRGTIPQIIATLEGMNYSPDGKVRKCNSLEEAQKAADENIGDYVVVILCNDPHRGKSKNKVHAAFFRDNNYEINDGKYGNQIGTDGSNYAIAGGGLMTTQTKGIFSNFNYHFGKNRDLATVHVYIYSKKK